MEGESGQITFSQIEFNELAAGDRGPELTEKILRWASWHLTHIWHMLTVVKATKADEISQGKSVQGRRERMRREQTTLENLIDVRDGISNQDWKQSDNKKPYNHLGKR